MVDVSNKQNNAVIKVTVSNGNTNITATADTAQYWSKQSRLSAENSKESAQESKHYAELANSYIDGFEGVVSNNTNNIIATSNDYINQITGTANTALTDIETARVEAVDNITTVKSESIASVEAKANEANALVNTGIADINTTKTNAVNAVTTTKNNAVTEISKEVTDGKKELNDIIEAGGLNINDKITNCLLEVPQNIKLELADGVLTLKAGSKVIVPNGAGMFDEVVITKDLSTAFDSNNQKMVFLNPAKNAIHHCNVINQQFSGASHTPTSSYNFWYDTTNNYVKFSNNSGTTWVSGYSLPICLVTRDSGIDQVFNGFGYIGSTVWVDKGVKGLIPNGRNTDGTLNNIEFTTQKVITGSIASNVTINNGKGRVLINSTGTGFIFRIGSYDAVNNYVLGANGVDKLIGCVVLDNGYVTNGHIDSFDFKLPFRAVDYNDFKKLHVNNPYFFGVYQWFERDPQNLSWLKSSGQWNSGSGYQAFYDWALANANAGKAGFKLSTASYTDYDFVVNKSNKTFRLPIKVQNTPMGGTAPVLAGEIINGFDKALRWRNADLSSPNSTNVTLGLYASTNNTSGTGCGGSQTNQTLYQALAPANLYADLSNATNSNLSLYFYVGETVRDEFLIDVGQIASNFADKIGRTECKAYITETYSSGTSWYRVWSDGFKEQGGTYDNGSVVRDKNGINVTFLKAFKNADYIITPFAYKNDNAPEYRTAVANVYYKTATQVTMGWYGTDGNQKVRYLNWYACGY